MQPNDRDDPTAAHSREDLARLTTEEPNPATAHLDEMSAVELVEIMNGEDRGVAEAVGRERDAIARAIELIAERMGAGGRLLYVGAGTSGRLGVLDAVECPPTFCTPPEEVVGLIAGGAPALTGSVEGAEDEAAVGERAVEDAGVGSSDVVVGIAASGRTPWVLGAVRRARALGATTVGLSCNAGSALSAVVDLAITPVVGPEVLAGSTRLKAGTATKMVLNMLTTGAMVLRGKVCGNLMVDVQATNQKLKARAVRIVRQLTGLDDAAAAALLGRCDGEVKTSLVVQKRGVSPDAARSLLADADGRLRTVLEADR